MPHIPNFPKDLLDQHHQWHDPAAHGNLGTIRLHPVGSTGGGTEFLVFHRNFVAQVLTWYFTTPFTAPPFDNPAQKASLVAPWTAIPAELKALPEYAFWKGDDLRLETGFPGFLTEDDLGFFIESRIHNLFLHGAAAAVFQEDEVRGFHSPLSTLFYKIHGLVDYWWSKWQRRHFFNPDRPVPGLGGTGIHGTGVFFPDRPVPGLGGAGIHGTGVFFPDRPVPGPSGHAHQPAVDPREVTSLLERVKLLESRAFPMRANLETPVEHAPVDKKTQGA